MGRVASLVCAVAVFFGQSGSDARAASPRRREVPDDLVPLDRERRRPLSVERFGAMHFTGSAVIKQSTFGITPLRVAGGAVRVKDDVHLIFDVRLE
jgi:hypothetical protein